MLAAEPNYRRCRMRLPLPQCLQDRTLPAEPNYRRCRMRLPLPHWLEDRTLPAARYYKRGWMKLPQPPRKRLSPRNPDLGGPRRHCPSKPSAARLALDWQRQKLRLMRPWSRIGMANSKLMLRTQL